MTEIKSTKPRDFYDFFERVKSDEAVFLAPQTVSLKAKTTSDLSAPPGRTEPQGRVPRGALMTVIKIMAALLSGRPVKLVPDGDEHWNVFYGPKA